jgi:hypothetical protein
MLFFKKEVAVIASLSPTRIDVELVLRIPGPWQSLQEFQDSLTGAVQYRDGRLVLEDGSAFEIQMHPMDSMLVSLFANSCRNRSHSNELRKIQQASNFVAVIGLGGSTTAAKQMLAAGAALIRAGGFGVFMDNSGQIHLGEDWKELADNSEDPEALIFAWICLFEAEKGLCSRGMHAFGHPDILMKGKRKPDQASVLLSLLSCIVDGTMFLEEGGVYMEPKIGAYKISTCKANPLDRKTRTHNPQGVWVLYEV